MQEELAMARQAATAGDRLAAVMHAHQGLETDVAAFQAAHNLIIKGQRGFGGFDPWQELRSAVERVTADVSVCLRLFNPRRKADSTKGMATVEALYRPANRCPEARLLAFADAVTKGLNGGGLPASVALEVGRALRKLNVGSAHKFLTNYLAECLTTLTSLTEEQGDVDISKHVRNVVMGDRDAVLRTLPAMVSLAVSCRAQLQSKEAEAQESVFLTHNDSLMRLLPPEVITELQAYSEQCQRELPQRCARLQEKEKREQEAAATQQQHNSNGSPGSTGQTSKSKQEIPSPSTAAVTTTGTASRRSAWQVLANPLNLSGWQLQVSRAALSLVILLLFRLLATKGLSTLKWLANLTRNSSSRTRRRKLML